MSIKIITTIILILGSAMSAFAAQEEYERLEDLVEHYYMPRNFQFDAQTYALPSLGIIRAQLRRMRQLKRAQEQLGIPNPESFCDWMTIIRVMLESGRIDTSQSFYKEMEVFLRMTTRSFERLAIHVDQETFWAKLGGRGYLQDHPPVIVRAYHPPTDSEVNMFDAILIWLNSGDQEDFYLMEELYEETVARIQILRNYYLSKEDVVTMNPDEYEKTNRVWQLDNFEPIIFREYIGERFSCMFEVQPPPLDPSKY